MASGSGVWWQYDAHEGPVNPGGAPVHPVLIGPVTVANRGEWIVYGERDVKNELWAHPANTPRPGHG